MGFLSIFIKPKGEKMFEKKRVTVAMAIAVLSTSMVFAVDVNPNDYKEVRIQSNLSKAIINKSMKNIKAHGLQAVVDPKFDCKSIGYSSKDIVTSGTMYGTNRKDGGIEISGTGDFKAYSYVRYAKNGKVCREKSYTKAYDPDHYGKHSLAVLFQ